MFICYLDESGVPELSAGTGHFVLLGLAIPCEVWKIKDVEVVKVKEQFGLGEAEIHAGWIARRYLEEERIPDFVGLSWQDRRKAVIQERKKTLLQVAALNPKNLKETQKNFQKTEPYIHLSRSERFSLLRGLADTIGRWNDSRLFGEAIDKAAISPQASHDIYERAFDQVVSRFHTFLENRGRSESRTLHGLLVQDNNPTISQRLTNLMRRFHKAGTMWTRIDKIVETPLFVDSQLTSMIQIADVAAYATRRFFEKGETDLFDRIYSRFDRDRQLTRVVGLRHYVGQQVCSCRVCQDHR